MRSNLNSVGMFFEDAFKSLKRNRTLTIASVLTVALTMFVLGVFLLTTIVINKNVNSLQDRLELKVFLYVPDTEEAKQAISDNVDEIKAQMEKDKKEIESILSKSNNVKEFNFVSSEDALKSTKEIYGDMLDGFEADFLPESYSIKFSKVEDIEKIKKQLNGIKSIESIKDGKDTAKKFKSMTNTIKVIAAGLFIVLFAVSLFLISNTIRLTVYSRRKEIGIMKNIGATDWFIRWPFVIEGMILGFFGTLISMVSLYGAYFMIWNNVGNNFAGILLEKPNIIISPMAPAFIFGGIVLGFIGSIISIRRFLSV
ncbi:permease-like cell division protein FtsX [uncultured Clostridium sp.]|uniref:permease-like cell division protein FtsX n=1 Tax=uncultured Clostridium sp. TaxID=59620 RepID=UPI0025F48BC5|nr:permease-like cell division protein FtsX [uncultured Clostridium sp.]